MDVVQIEIEFSNIININTLVKNVVISALIPLELTCN